MDNKSFNELFNEFFKRNNIKPEDKLDDSIKDDAKRMIDMLKKFTDFDGINGINESMEESFDSELGKPDKIEFFNEGNLFFERRIWITPHGTIEKLIGSDDPTLINKPPVNEKSLQLKLDEAVNSENYEKAAAIRDEIKKLKKTKKKTK